MVRMVWTASGYAAAFVMTAIAGWVVLSGTPARATDPPGVAARSIALRQDQNIATVSVDLAAPVAARTFFLNGEQPRFVLDLPGVRWRIGSDPAPAAPSGPVRGLRYAQHDSGVSRLVLDLAAPGQLLDQTEQPLANGGRRLTYQIRVAVRPVARPAPSSRPEPAQIERVARQSTTPATAPRRTGARHIVVIDAGHGGRDPGAIGTNGTQEKAITLQSALRLRQLLEATGRYQVVLTRDADIYVDLADRVRFARTEGAELFISLHADAAANPEAHGASVYTLSEQGGQRAQRIMGQQNWRLDLGHAPTSGAVNQILVDMAQRDTTNRSASFARTLINHLEPVAPLLRNTHRSAGFFVLLAPDVPAVLVELGFLTNPRDERRLGSAAERDSMMRAVASAIDAHFAGPQLLLAAR
jgi:N-acetylmuramoyl-L-alanine amidase